MYLDIDAPAKNRYAGYNPTVKERRKRARRPHFYRPSLRYLTPDQYQHTERKIFGTCNYTLRKEAVDPNKNYCYLCPQS